MVSQNIPFCIVSAFIAAPVMCDIGALFIVIVMTHVVGYKKGT
jgi:hypothetical protein